ncbi:MAG: aminoacetone oxidase family FAD-binding enzyme [Clostridia bacterium]|nr:aminoacetone oxidase family FAD-binding enzyme [Clostridia bacterium]
MNRKNFKVYKAVIIGGGFSGLVTDVKLSRRFGGENIAVVEKLSRVGKKILSTGNGQCNLTNIDYDFSHFHGKNPQIHEKILKKHSNLELLDFFENLGVLTVLEDGKYFPNSKQASSVLDALRFKLDYEKVNFYLGVTASGTNRENFYKISLSDGSFLYGENLVVSVGGKSAPFLGTDGSSYNLLTCYGHTLTKLYPSLVQLKTDKAKIKGLKGLKQRANLTVVSSNKIITQKFGEVLFTEYGVSGNAVFNASSYAVDKDCKLLIDFLPKYSSDELLLVLQNKQKNCPYLTIENLLSGIINNKIGASILRSEGILDLSQKVKNVNLNLVVKAVKSFALSVTGNMGFDNSQVTKGGILLSEFDSNTLESKLSKGLFATGEVLDVDGDCGGYNLQWAYSSASTVAESIK